jgi:maleate isomerase
MVLARGRVGVIMPADGDCDADLWKYVPKNAVVMVTRLRLLGDNPGSSLTAEALRHIGESKEIENCALALKSSRAEAIAYACTSGSFQRPGMNAEIVKRIEEATGGIEATTTSLACKEALLRLNIVKVAVLSPYPDHINFMLKDYLLRNGFQVANFASLNLAPGSSICDVSPWELYQSGKKADVPGAEGLFIPCTGLSTAEMIQPLEHDLDKPVVTANQATMWKLLQMLRIREPVQGVGSLLESHAVVRTPCKSYIRSQ